MKRVFNFIFAAMTAILMFGVSMNSNAHGSNSNNGCLNYTCSATSGNTINFVIVKFVFNNNVTGNVCVNGDGKFISFDTDLNKFTTIGFNGDIGVHCYVYLKQNRKMFIKGDVFMDSVRFDNPSQDSSFIYVSDNSKLTLIKVKGNGVKNFIVLGNNAELKIGNTTYTAGSTIFLGGNNNEVKVMNCNGAPSSSLPLSLTSFSMDGTFLKWSVVDESELMKYDVEYSSNGYNFESIKTIFSERKDKNNYSMRVDKNGFYRLKMVNDDATFKYSSVVKFMKGETFTKILKINNQYVSVNGDSRNYLYDINGKMISEITESNFNMSLTSGMYILRSVNGLDIKTYKIML